MSIGLGLTGVPHLSPTGQPLDYQLEEEMHQTFSPPPYASQRLKMPLYALPLTPDASPADWDKEEYSCPPTPPGHASATHPPGAPMYGLGYPQSVFEESLQTITIRAPRRVHHEVVEVLPTPQATPALAAPPFNRARPKRLSIALPRIEESRKSEERLTLFSPAPNQTQFGSQRRRKWTQLYRRIFGIVVLGLLVLVTSSKIARSSWLSDWKKHNAQWSANVHELEDKVYGLEEDFMPRYFHRSQRQQYIQYSTRVADNENVHPSFNEVEKHVFAEDDLTENQDSFFTTFASDIESAAIYDRIDELLSLSEVTPYMSGHAGDLRAVYIEGITASVADLESAMKLDGPATISLLGQLDASRRQFLKTMIRYLSTGGQLPLGWGTETSLESVMRQVWTIPGDEAFTELFAGPSASEVLFAADWQEGIADKACVTVFTNVSSLPIVYLTIGFTPSPHSVHHRVYCA